jgi:hypothetical protein
MYEIIEDSVWRADDGELVELLRRVYVEGGFTDPTWRRAHSRRRRSERADALFARSPSDDFERDGRVFHVYRRRFDGVCSA